ncbi:acidic fibroblast growth factor binding-domain-containing protein [Chytriomyces cf. hyalinus JEL632]|nr:acidic fibroblast growth factor binding-domain-containing protein [Chytriomyces cf. hyalinus JEL632]
MSFHSTSSLHRGSTSVTAAAISSAAKNVVSSVSQSMMNTVNSSSASTTSNLPTSTSYSSSNSISVAVFFTNELHVDSIAWQLWLAGFSVDQACTRILKERTKQAEAHGKSISYQDHSNPVIIKNYITSQYRNFEILENYLHRPKLLFSQLIFPLDTNTKQYLIDSYYRFEPKVLRELLGKKLSSRAMRKELEDAHDRSGVPVAGCRRMFDNLKRIMKRCEDLDGNIFRIIQTDFLLQNDLAAQYSHVIFINFYRLDTTKKKLSNLTFGDFEYLGSIIMNYFTMPSSSAIPDVDMNLAQDARDLKSLIVNHKDILDDFRARVLSHLQTQQQQCILLQQQQQQSEPPLPPTIFIGAGLSYNKELRDVFVQFVEKVVEPCAAMGWGPMEIYLLLVNVAGTAGAAGGGALEACFENVELLAIHHRKRYTASLARLCRAVGLAAGQLS